ncbi:MAG: hypothetical protein GX911_07810 [Spirochaetales bacterium]|nr:hypothetical protein [Spirochaetales bacterium]
MKKRVLLLLLIPLLLASCRSAKDLPGSGAPSWAETAEEAGSQVFFHGEGRGLDPYRVLFGRIEEAIGSELDSRYLDELIDTGGIADLDLMITNRYRSGDEIHLRARAAEETIERLKAELARERQDRADRIEELLQEANLAYKANEDTRTIACYLEAARIASEGRVGPRSHQPEALVAEAVGYIEPLQFVLTRSESASARTTVTLRRRTRLLAPRVLNAPIAARYEARNPLGARYEDVLFFNSHASGQLLFEPLNTAMKSEGVVTFFLNLEIPPLEPDLVRQVEEALKKVSIEFPYSLSAPFGPIGVSLKEYSVSGDPLSTAHAGSAFSEGSRLDGIRLVEVALERTAESELEDLVRQIPRDLRYTVIGSVGVLGYDKALDETIAVVSGSFILYDSVRSTVLYHSQDIEAVGWGADREEAKALGFKRFGLIAEYLFRTVLTEVR